MMYDYFLTSLILIGFGSIIIYLSFTRKSKNGKLPPGNLGWPVIGETLAFASSGLKNCHRNFFAERMKNYSSEVFKTSILGENMAVLCGPQGNKFVFSNENKLLRSWWPSTVDKITFAGSGHSGLRSRGSSSVSSAVGLNFRVILSEILKMDGLHDFVPVIQSITNQHLERDWRPNHKVIVFPLVNKLTFALACRLFIGLEDPETVAKVKSYYTDVAAGLLSLPVDLPGTAMNRGIKAAKAIQREILPIIKQKRSELEGKNSDLLSRLLMKSDEDGRPVMSDEFIADHVLGIIIASQDTTTSVITMAIYYLADHPHVYQRIFQEQMEILKTKGSKEMLKWEDIQKMKYSRNVINEVLRMSPPALGSFKEAISDFTYAGYTIPKGWKVFWSVHTTHDNPKQFPDPEKFDPSRFEGYGPPPFTFTPFGGGPRMCPGSEFARVEILIVLHCLVTAFRWEKIIPDEKVACTLSPKPVKDLPVQLFPHQI